MRYETTLLERLLAAPTNMAQKQLVWTATSFAPKEVVQCAEWIEIRAVRSRVVAQPHLAGMKKIVLAKASEVESSGKTSG
jgi:hypothetical protein